MARIIDSDYKSSTFYKCDSCGKKFIIPCIDSWTYKRMKHINQRYGTSKYFCGWNCMRKYDREIEEEKERKRQERIRKQRKY